MRHYRPNLVLVSLIMPDPVRIAYIAPPEQVFLELYNLQKYSKFKYHFFLLLAKRSCSELLSVFLTTTLMNSNLIITQ